MNYYIQGNKDKVEQIKAAFEAKGYDTGNLAFTSSQLYYTIEGKVELMCTKSLQNLIKTHPDYKELELPVKPKFKAGDWIVANDIGIVSQITKVINDTDEYGEYRAYEHTNGYFAACFENEYHLWTIKDAKDGDVLVVNGSSEEYKWIGIFKAHTSDISFSSHCHYNCGMCEFVTNIARCTKHGTGKYSDIRPATNEERDLLFQKMNEAGYQWDEKKKELKKIQKHYDISSFYEGMPVLVRDAVGEEWRYTEFSHISSRFGENKFAAGCTYWRQCIPFEGNEHLLGTTDMPSEEYINW